MRHRRRNRLRWAITTKNASNSAAPAATVTVTVTSTAAAPAPAPAPAPTTTVVAAPKTTAPAAPKTTAAAAPKPSYLLSSSGHGIKNTAKFTTSDDWTIHYTYNCSGFALGSGNFAVTVYTEGSLDTVAVNELGKKGSDSSPVYDDGGTHYLSINSECSWTVKVTNG